MTLRGSLVTTDPFAQYTPLAGPDEMFQDGLVRPVYSELHETLTSWDEGEYDRRQTRADIALLTAGITFNVYSDGQATERIFPFSLIPRIVSGEEWAPIEAGLAQRVRALNLFLVDVYNERHVIRDGIIPAEIVYGAPGYSELMRGFRPPQGVYAHIAGIDLIRDESGQFVVLEDNLRTPSGVSYVLENRAVMLRVVPDIFPERGVARVGDYPEQLLRTLVEIGPDELHAGHSGIVLLTPGIYNSAYFEHAFLSQQMGVPLVEGSDLLVRDDRVYLRSTTGLEPVHVIYRRIDDDFLDPEVFNPDSLLGVPGLMRAYRAGNVTLANGVGTGVADDKVVYRWVPDLIRYFLGEEPILPNVPTYIPIVPKDLAYIEAHARELVLKPANASGGYGLVIGPQATDEEVREAVARVRAEPREWIAQPLVEFSTIPTFGSRGPVPRRADLRPFVLSGATTWVMPGGLTRVALQRGSYVVNSSQGGGSKDTWVLEQATAGEDAAGGPGRGELGEMHHA